MSTGSKTIADLPEVQILDDKDQFLFFQNSTKKAKRITKGNMAISGGGLRGKFIDAATGNDVGLTSATAIANSATALSTANGAQATADGRNRIFYQPSPPTSPAGGYALINGDLWFDNSTEANYAMYTWNTSLPGTNKWQVREIADLSIARINAGKITAGFIGAQVIAINGTDVYGNPIGAGGYIESTSFVLTWPGANFVNVKTYNGSNVNLGKSVASDVVQTKVLQSDGSFKLFRAIADQLKSASQVAPPSSGSNAYWTEITGASIPTFTVPINSSENATIQNFGFRISSNGFAEFGGALFRGAVIANEGYFGTTSNAARIDANGLIIGSTGRIKSSALTYSTSGAVGGTKGFFLGNTGTEYEFFIGDSSKYARWDGSNLSVSGNIVGGSTVGTNSTDVGLVMNTQFGIRRSVSNGTLTINGGDGNGVQFGAQIDLVGAFLNTSGSDTGNGQLILQAAYNGSNNFNGPQDGSIVFRTSKFTTVSSADIGIMRMLIALDGTVLIGKGDETAASGAPNDGSGKLIVSNTITAGGGDLFGNNSNGIIYVKNNSDVAKITMTASSGDVTADTFTTSSSKKFKTNIKKLKSGIDIIDKLKPVSFKRKDSKQKDIGLIAEEVDKILPVIVKHNDKNEAEGLDYSKLTVVLINAVKQLSTEVKELKKKLKDANSN
jgi:hypothetical protein